MEMTHAIRASARADESETVCGEQVASINGVALRYRVAGDGPALVMQAPGWGVGGAYLEQTMEPLEACFRVVYHDPRGSGRSARPARAGAITVGQMVDDLDALRRHLDRERFALLGHSHGAYIALNYALCYPQRLSHLVLVGPMLGLDELNADTGRSVPRLARQPEYAAAAEAWHETEAITSDETFGEWLARTMPLYFHRPEIGMEIFARLNQGAPALAAYQGTRATDRQFAVRDALHRVRVPTLILTGRHDFKTPPESVASLNRAIPGSRMVVFEESGHFPWFEEPGAFFREVRAFL
jgi:proline iminopeptidase